MPAEKLRPTWRSGFISTGYFVAVPWQTYPSNEKVRVAVRLTTLDGRAFEADKDVTVKVCQTPRVGPPAIRRCRSRRSARVRASRCSRTRCRRASRNCRRRCRTARGAKLLPPEKN